MKKTIGTTPVSLVEHFASSRTVVQNLGPGTVFLDSSKDVTPETGFRLMVDSVYEFPTASNLGGPMYVVSDEADTDVRIMCV